MKYLYLDKVLDLKIKREANVRFYHLMMCCLIAIILSSTSNAMDNKTEKTSTGFTIGKVRSKLRATPRYQIQNYPTSSATQRWLEVSIDYLTPALKSSSNGAKYRWLDDVTMEVEILFPAMIDNRQVMARATGSVDFWSIKMDGKRHYAIMLLQPQILARYGLVRAYKEEDFVAKISLYRGRKLIFKTFSSHRKLSRKKIIQAFAKYSGKLKSAKYLELGKVILSRDKTPWAFVQYDKYDMIKPESDMRR